MFTKIVFLVAAAASTAFAQQAAYAQCGGENFTGETSCVSGYTCTDYNPFYSQCVASTGDTSDAATTTSEAAAATSSATEATSTTSSATSTTSSATSAASSATSAAAAASSSASSSSSSGTSYKASFTEYGSGDDNGSGNCNVATTACGFYTNPGYSAAVSQNLFGVGPGAGAGPACGTCYKLTVETDSSGNTLSNAGNSIVVQVTNLCPADGNPLCAQSGLTGTNQYGANVNFDTCIDSGASAALFGDSGVGLAVGTAEEVDCSEWTGTVES